MDYIGNKCPVCDKYFHIGDDIVVCPECGTPHHRECYNENGKCANENKHKDGYDYQQNIKGTEEVDDDGIICKKCGAKNSKDAFFCSKCSNALQENVEHNHQNIYGNYHNTQNSSAPFPNNPNVIMFDPLAGVSPSADIGDGVTVGECAKFVKQNTPYFITIFNQIQKFTKSRFNFCAMFFGGGYLLFRKMYKVGSIITAIQGAMLILYYYLNYYISQSNVYDKFLESLYSYDTNATMVYMAELSTTQFAIILMYFAIAVMLFLMGIVIGACANRLYYNHCKKQICKIKNQTENGTERDNMIEKKGGVNTPLAFSLWITYFILSYLPMFF